MYLVSVTLVIPLFWPSSRLQFHFIMKNLDKCALLLSLQFHLHLAENYFNLCLSAANSLLSIIQYIYEE